MYDESKNYFLLAKETVLIGITALRVQYKGTKTAKSLKNGGRWFSFALVKICVNY